MTELNRKHGYIRGDGEFVHTMNSKRGPFTWVGDFVAWLEYRADWLDRRIDDVTRWWAKR